MATYKGDTPLIKYDCGETITDLTTTPLLYYKKPGGATGSWVATLTTQYAQYQAVAATLNEAGTWKIHPKLSDGTYTYYGTIQELVVAEPVK